MNRTRLTTLIAGLALTLAPSLFAGEIGEDLSRKINSSRQDEKIRVWITLPRAESASKFKATLLSQSDTRRGRHELALKQLKDENSHAQSGLINALEQLESRGRATRIKSHWITNLVEAEVAAGELRALAARGDVERVIIPPEIVLIAPVEEKSVAGGALAPDSITSNLKYIRAPEAWAAGYTGTGRVICSFDTGIQGSHPALYSSWKGLDGDSAAAWFDPIKHQSFPHTIPDCGLTAGCVTNHGTHVMGILVGHTSSDTIGVAPGAKWISAAVIDIAGASIIDGFEWAADPDGDPNTVSDVPDVINHSWGLSKSVAACENIFFDVIDNVEALGIVNIFAAGNRYEPADTIVFNPANRATDSIASFAVGNLNTTVTPATLNRSSSHGPSDCVGPSFKPNVVAPGTSIYSSWPGDTYNVLSGTSMAAPHVSGLVALLRQKNPNATVDQIKTAILNGAQKDPSWLAPNNHYGWGAIDCMGALDTLPTIAGKPNIRIYAFDHAPIHPGDTVTGQVTLQNLGSTVSGVTGVLLNSDPSLTVLDAVATFGSLLRNTTVQSPENLRVVVSDTVSTGSLLGLDFVIFSGLTAIDTLHLSFQVVPPLVKTIASHVTSRLAFSLSNWGGLGLGPGSQFPAGGLGFDFNGGGNDLYEGGLMMGNSAFRVSSAVHSYFWDPDMDFNVAPGGNLVLQVPGPIAAQQTYSAFIDSHAADPFDILVKQNSYTYDPPDDDFVILQYVLQNTSGVTITNFYFGIFLDWDIYNYASDAGGYESADGIAWMAYNNGTSLSEYRAVKLLEGPFYTAQTGRSDLIVYAKYLSASGNGYTTSEKYNSLSNGTASADTYKSSRYDLFQVMAAGPMVLAPGAEQTVTFALLAGDTYADIANAAARATLAPTPVEEPPDANVLPKTFALYQNYPNPFNPSTVISFDLPRASEYTLTIFNVLGQKVYEVTGQGRAGRVDVDWDASSFSSGVYFYRVATDKFSESKKMLLLK